MRGCGCTLHRQLTVSQPSHGECAERQPRFDHLSRLTDSVYKCVCYTYGVCWYGAAEDCERLTKTPWGDMKEISELLTVSNLWIHGKHARRSNVGGPTIISWGFTAVAIIISSKRAVLLPALPAETSSVLGIRGHFGSSSEALGAADRFLILTHQFILAVRRWSLQVSVGVDLICLGIEDNTVSSIIISLHTVLYITKTVSDMIQHTQCVLNKTKTIMVWLNWRLLALIRGIFRNLLALC